MSKRKFTRDEARHALLFAGREMLTEVGLSGGAGRVTLAEAITRSGVPRPSAYRVFGGTNADPQQVFHEELIVELATEGPVVDIEGLASPVQAVLDEVEALGVEATPEELTWYLRELIRTASIAAAAVSLTETPMGVYMAVLASTLDPSRNDRVEAAAREAEASSVGDLIPFVRETLASFGLRLRDGWSLIELSSAITASILGALLTGRVSPAPQELQLKTGKNGEPQLWSPLGVTLLGIVGQATQPDPRMVASAQPSRWFI